MIDRVDDLSRTLRLERAARRIVCLVPSITETLFSLGAGDRIVGVTDYCIHPAEGVQKKEKVGGTKNFFVQKVLALRPDLVIANAEENRKHQVEKLEEAGLKVFVTFPKSVDGCVKMIADLAALTDSGAAGESLQAAIGAARAGALAAAPDPQPGVFCPIWRDPYLTINRDTYIDNVIRSSGGRNIFADRPDRYPEITLAEVAALQPDVILLPTEPYHFTEDDVSALVEIGDRVPAVRNRRIHIVEGELLSWYGPRLARALVDISSLLRA
jgi:ABC-type Fe3+-hydroxamate transport system substrate-binding protein